MTFVQPPVPPDRQPAASHDVECEVGGPDRPGEHRGVEDPQVEVGLREEPA